MSISTPVAFFIFNRPDLTEIVFDAIAQAKPKKLLVVADGSRFPEEAQKCQKTRSVIDKIDWECEVLTNYAEKNMGCKHRVSTGLDWVFAQVEEAIILEDDCLPAPSFFYFCETLLARYRHDERIMMISGDNFQNGQPRNDYSYYFSKYTHIWGWASWRRAWQHYDVNMKTWPEYKKSNAICSVCEDRYEQQYWIDTFDRVFDGAVDTWDYQWLYASWCQSGLSILPNSNLISNVGFGVEGTHTSGDSPWARLPIADIWDIKHPPFMVRDKLADTYTFMNHYGGINLKKRDSLMFKIKNKYQLLKKTCKQYLKGVINV